MILHPRCAKRAIAKQINATQAPPENSSQNEQKHLALQHRGQPRTRCGVYVTIRAEEKALKNGVT
jgi:hypothetical protein